MELFFHGAVHDLHCVCCWSFLCSHKRQDRFGGSNSDKCCGCRSNSLYLLGFEKRTGFQFPRTLFIQCCFSPYCFRVDSVPFPSWKVVTDDLWWPGRDRILWFHRLWHWQLDQAFQLRRVHLSSNQPLSWYYQSIPCSPQHIQRSWQLDSSNHLLLIISFAPRLDSWYRKLWNANLAGTAYIWLLHSSNTNKLYYFFILISI